MISSNFITNACLLILFLPLVAFLVNIFFGKRLPRQGDWISIGAIITTLVLSLSLLIGMFVIEDTIDVTMPIPAEGPSLGVAPSGTCI